MTIWSLSECGPGTFLIISSASVCCLYMCMRSFTREGTQTTSCWRFGDYSESQGINTEANMCSSTTNRLFAFSRPSLATTVVNPSGAIQIKLQIWCTGTSLQLHTHTYCSCICTPSSSSLPTSYILLLLFFPLTLHTHTVTHTQTKVGYTHGYQVFTVRLCTFWMARRGSTNFWSYSVHCCFQ